MCIRDREKIAPKIVDYVKSATKPQLEKLVGIFNLQYNNGDVDTRAIITIVLLNALDDEQFNTVFEYLSDDLKKAAKAARKYKDKKVKPEKPKKKNVSKASTLND